MKRVVTWMSEKMSLSGNIFLLLCMGLPFGHYTAYAFRLWDSVKLMPVKWRINRQSSGKTKRLHNQIGWARVHNWSSIETFQWSQLLKFNRLKLSLDSVGGFCRGAGRVQWWEHSPPTNVARVWFPDPASNVGWVCWFSSLHREVFSGYTGFLSPQKPKFELIVLIVNLIYSVPN